MVEHYLVEGGERTVTFEQDGDVKRRYGYQSITPTGQSAQVEHYIVENGDRTLAFEQDGDVKRRVQYGPTGEVLFDQIFSAAGAPTLQAEQDLQILLGDHQHSTRIVVAHDSNDAAYVQQSLSYTPFGQLLDLVLEDGSVPIDYPESMIVASYGFQGMMYDGAIGLYRTQARIYDADLGRFVSEDPIQDGTNWYMFSGNDPINQRDPTGLSLQGHPLAGGYSGNVTRQPTISSGNIPANNLFGGPALSPSLNNFIKGAVNQALNPARLPSSAFGGFVDAGGPRILIRGGGAARSVGLGLACQFLRAWPKIIAEIGRATC